VSGPRSRAQIFDDLHAIGFSVWFDEGPVAEAVARSRFIHVSLPVQYDRLPRLVELLTELHGAPIPAASESPRAGVRSKAFILDELHALGLSVWFDAGNVAVEGAMAFDTLPRFIELLSELHTTTAARR